MSVALITSIYGHYDRLTDPPEQEGVDEYIAVVDRPHEGSVMWRQIVEPRPHMHPRLAAKVAKCNPELYVDADYTVWVDGSARLKSTRVAQWAVAGLYAGTTAQFRHPERLDVSAEAAVSRGMEKYFDQPVEAQAAHYKKEGLPDNWGLWATGFIVRARGSRAAELGRRWLHEQIRWSYQDQVSQPYVLWANEFPPPDQLEGDLWGNPHVYFEGHASGA